MKKMIFLGLGWALILFPSLNAQATTTIAGVSGASNFDFSSATSPKIYGGYVMNASTCAMDTVTTCNTCDGACAGGNKMCPCNQNSIYPTLRLAATFNSTIDLGGRYVLYQLSSAATPSAFSPSTVLASGATSFSFNQPWSFWCGLAGLTSCTSATLDGATISVIVGPSKTTSATTFEEAEKITLEIKIGIVDRTPLTSPYYAECSSTAGSALSGICYYEVERGDEKVFLTITDNQTASDYPAASTNAAGLEYSSMLFFLKETTDPTTIKNSDDAAELSVDVSGSDISFDDRITELSNDTKYCFVLGNMDQTGNIHSFQDPATLGARGCATPSAVEGLLDDKKCFIATAAFGSNLDPQVELLRKFRSQFLMSSSWGTKFVKFYYNNSSVWAQKIRHSEGARAVVRGLLWPAVGFAALSLKIGMTATLILIFSMITLLCILIIRRKKINSKIFAKFGLFIFLCFFSLSLFSPIKSEAQTSDDSSAVSPENDDFEEGGPPQESPPAEVEFDEFNDTANENKSAEEKIETSKKTIVAPAPENAAVIAAPETASQNKSSSYKTPSKPTTQEGRELGYEKIPHPMAKEGLLSIEKDGSYYYQPVSFEKKNESIGFRAGGVLPAPNIVGPDGSTSFSAMYGSSPFQVTVDYEWYPFVKWGKLGLQGGAGFFTSTGNGRFAYASNDTSAACNPAVEECEAREKYTFYGVPVSLGLIYRLQVTDRPYFAPYIAGGGSYYLLIEKRDDSKPFKAVGTIAGYGGGGVMFNISAFDRTTAFTLESEYGLHNVWVNADYRYVAGLSKVLNVSASIVSLGLVMDY